MTREFVQLSQFTRQWKDLGCDDDGLRELEEFLCLRPDHGDVVIGTGGLRKIRWKFGSSGKRGGLRVLYVDFPEFEKLYLLGVYTKTIRVDLSKKEAAEVRKMIICIEGRIEREIQKAEDRQMARTEKGSVFNDIVSGLNEAVRYERTGNTKGIRTRRVTIAPVPHYGASTIKSIRSSLRLSQITFAEALGVSKKTVEAWEAGTNIPQGPAQRMLELLQKEHDLLEKHEILIT